MWSRCPKSRAGITAKIATYTNPSAHTTLLETPPPQSARSILKQTAATPASTASTSSFPTEVSGRCIQPASHDGTIDSHTNSGGFDSNNSGPYSFVPCRTRRAIYRPHIWSCPAAGSSAIRQAIPPAPSANRRNVLTANVFSSSRRAASISSGVVFGRGVPLDRGIIPQTRNREPESQT